MFNGNKDNSILYTVKLQAFGALQGFSDALDPNFKSQLAARHDSVLDETNSAQKAQAMSREMNARAINYIIVGQEDEKMINMLGLCQSPEWPMGLAYEWMTRFKKKFQPDDETARVDMED